MKLRELMDNATDLTWFYVVEPNGKGHPFDNADYFGGHKDTLDKLTPFLDRTIFSFGAEMIFDPEPDDPEVVEKIPAIWVDLAKSNED